MPTADRAAEKPRRTLKTLNFVSAFPMEMADFRHFHIQPNR
ncbi:hypothetical protein [Sphingomonas gilva]|nr:hypothetical protein [Sphingomonas gilva]